MDGHVRSQIKTHAGQEEGTAKGLVANIFCRWYVAKVNGGLAMQVEKYTQRGKRDRSRFGARVRPREGLEECSSVRKILAAG